MTEEFPQDIRNEVIERVRQYSAETGDLLERHLGELFPDPWDFIELCWSLEERYGIDLRPFFEDGQPEVGWWIWRRKAARDVTVRELSEHIADLVGSKSG
jgi:hypothetical protein